MKLNELEKEIGLGKFGEPRRFALEHQINETITCTAIMSLKSLQHQQSEKYPGQLLRLHVRSSHP